jgi:hypothetical protein
MSDEELHKLRDRLDELKQLQPNCDLTEEQKTELRGLFLNSVKEMQNNLPKMTTAELNDLRDWLIRTLAAQPRMH